MFFFRRKYEADSTTIFFSRSYFVLFKNRLIILKNNQLINIDMMEANFKIKEKI